MTTLRINHLEEWILEELQESQNWVELVGVDAFILRCIRGPNRGLLVGNTDEIDLDDSYIAMTTLFGDE